MNVAFHAPLKSPGHPVPSGDRLMARLLIAALRMGGHEVDIVSELRSFMGDPSPQRLAEIEREARAERERIASRWLAEGVPDLWFCYHPYYKAPDLIGPLLCERFGLAYVTAEASYSRRRNVGVWSESQSKVIGAVGRAAVNICFTQRDRDGLLDGLPTARTAILPPFIDSSVFLDADPHPQPGRLVAIAMMRSGDKMDSYRMLAAALALLPDLAWRLSVIGDGPARTEVEALFAAFPKERIDWRGKQDAAQIAEHLSDGAVYVWPGCGEAYGLAYLEAQASGLPVVAQAVAGVPEVVVHGRTGLLTAPGDVIAYAGAIRRLLEADQERQQLATAARRFVTEERSLVAAADRLDAILREYVGVSL